MHVLGEQRTHIQSQLQREVEYVCLLFSLGEVPWELVGSMSQGVPGLTRGGEGAGTRTRGCEGG